MNIENHYENIKGICAFFAGGTPHYDDLVQEVCLHILENKDSFVGYNESSFNYLIYRMVYLRYNCESSNVAKGYKDNANFIYKFMNNPLTQAVDYEDLKYCLTTEETPSNINTVNEVVSKLDPHEQNVIREYLRFNMNMTLFSKNCGVCRKDLKLRVDNIIEKCKTI